MMDHTQAAQRLQQLERDLQDHVLRHTQLKAAVRQLGQTIERFQGAIGIVREILSAPNGAPPKEP